MAKLIAFTGKMGAGKTTAAQIAQELLPDSHVFKLAQPIYDIQNYIYERVYGSRPAEKDRKLLQWIGTEWGRARSEDLWVDAFSRDVRRALSSGRTALNDDVRFDNEARAVHALGGVVIEVVASEQSRASRIQLVQTGHASEAGVSQKLVDYHLINDGVELEFLKHRLASILKDCGAL